MDTIFEQNIFFDDEKKSNIVHIRIQQRNAKKTITTIEGLDTSIDIKRLLKYIKKKFNCNGSIIITEDDINIIQLQGDQRNNMKNFLIQENIVSNEFIKVHGF
jgi:translation initiation factor 1|tara:strand:- start:35 stop:343 length:309 start_codon:yes stop_codon:yes gene_type:complete